MAAGDIVQRKVLTNVQTVTGGFDTTATDGNYIILFSGNSYGTTTVSSPPSGFTQLEFINPFPSLAVYAKIANSETNSYSITWTAATGDCSMVLYEVEGSSASLGDISSGTGSAAGGSYTDEAPTTALASTGAGVAILFGQSYNLENNTFACDNSFTIRGQSASYRYLYADKVITGADSDIQSTVTWTNLGSSFVNAMVLIEPAAGGGSFLNLSHYYRMHQ